jgi:hypothetical protein
MRDNDEALPKFNDLLLLTNKNDEQVFGVQQDKQSVFRNDLIYPKLGNCEQVVNVCV